MRFSRGQILMVGDADFEVSCVLEHFDQNLNELRRFVRMRAVNSEVARRLDPTSLSVHVNSADLSFTFCEAEFQLEKRFKAMDRDEPDVVFSYAGSVYKRIRFGHVKRKNINPIANPYEMWYAIYAYEDLRILVYWQSSETVEVYHGRLLEQVLVSEKDSDEEGSLQER